MNLAEQFLAELDREAPKSRKTLERVPEGKAEWKPHPKSMNLGYLSMLVAIIPDWISKIIELEELDIAPKGGGQAPPPPQTRAELLAAHEKSLEQARAALKKTNDVHLQKTWKLLAGGTVVAEMPRYILSAIRCSTTSRIIAAS
jgi:hypothetical protein